MFKIRLLAVLLVVVCFVSVACGQTTTWQPVGLCGGGGMFNPVISPADPKTAMIHCDMSDVFLTHDNGQSWEMVHTAQLRSNTRCRGAFHPTDVNIIISPGGSSTLKITHDGGKTWQELAKFNEALVGRVVMNPDNPEQMLVGVGKTTRYSIDGGKTWRECKDVRGAIVNAYFIKETCYLATEEGVYCSGNLGGSWLKFSDELQGLRGFTGGTKDGITTLYCTVPGKDQEGKYVGGIYRWRTGDTAWQSVMGTGLNMDIKPFDKWAHYSVAQYFDVVTTDLAPETVYVSSANTGIPPPHHATVYRSDDAGKTWRATFYGDPRYPGCNVEKSYMTAEDGQFYQHIGELAINPRDPEHVLQVEGSWTYYTLDGGKSWQSTSGSAVGEPQHNAAWQNSGLVVTTTWHYYIDPHQSNRHYICYTDIGFARSLDAGKTWIWWAHADSSPWRNTCYDVAFDPEIPGKMWGAFSNLHDIPNDNVISERHNRPSSRVGGVCVSNDFADTWTVVKGELPVLPCTSLVLDAKSPKNARTLYATFFSERTGVGGGVYKSVDDGKTWTAKNKGLGDATNMRAYRISIHPDGTLFCVITALTENNRKFQQPGAGLYRSTDGAESWQCISGSIPALWPKDFTVDPQNSKIVYLGLSDANGEKCGGLYRTKDGGKSWNLLTRNGPQHFGAYLHPSRPGWIYATLCENSPDYGLFLSKDDGKTFKPVRGMPFDNAMRVTFDPADANTIYVSTFGGSVWKGPAE
ncbi:MAG: hypothetical protein FWD61_05555 [Phycisphaerales bacterium]|nr:hypothetical protein [Phycisphaerales bacterium]